MECLVALYHCRLFFLRLVLVRNTMNMGLILSGRGAGYFRFSKILTESRSFIKKKCECTVQFHNNSNWMYKLTCYTLECVTLYRMLGVSCVLQYQHFSVFFNLCMFFVTPYRSPFEHVNIFSCIHIETTTGNVSVNTDNWTMFT